PRTETGPPRFRQTVPRSAPDGDPAAPREPEDGRGRCHPHRDAPPRARRSAPRTRPVASLAEPPARAHGGAPESGHAAPAHDAAAGPVDEGGAPRSPEEHRDVDRAPRDRAGATRAPAASAQRWAEDHSLSTL